VVDVLGLIGNLQTRRTHAKMHSVHVNLSWERLTLLSRHHVGVLVLEKRDLDINLLAAPLVDGLSETEETWVFASGLFRQEYLVGVFIKTSKFFLIACFYIATDLFVFRGQAVRSA